MDPAGLEPKIFYTEDKCLILRSSGPRQWNNMMAMMIMNRKRTEWHPQPYDPVETATFNVICIRETSVRISPKGSYIEFYTIFLSAHFQITIHYHPIIHMRVT